MGQGMEGTGEVRERRYGEEGGKGADKGKEVEGTSRPPRSFQKVGAYAYHHKHVANPMPTSPLRSIKIA